MNTVFFNTCDIPICIGWFQRCVKFGLHSKLELGWFMIVQITKSQTLGYSQTSIVNSRREPVLWCGTSQYKPIGWQQSVSAEKAYEKCPGSLWKCRGNNLELAPSPTRKTRTFRHPKRHTRHSSFPLSFRILVHTCLQGLPNNHMVTTEV